MKSKLPPSPRWGVIFRQGTKIPKRKLNQILKHDLWFDAKKCLEYGLVDDIWRSTQNDELFIVEYKTTTVKRKKKTINKQTVLGEEIKPDLNEKGAPYKYWYKKQVEFYQWLLRKNDFNVSNVTYFLFCSGRYKEIHDFSDKMQFRIDILEHVGNDDWVDETIINIKNVLDGEQIPDSNPNCDHCNYAKKINNVTNQ